ncbi:MAG: hypothetical protein OXC18_02240 [Desulfurellaceae bacterium]|nr:hypothetical protein [Desulfurellaceae bacterium]
MKPHRERTRHTIGKHYVETTPLKGGAHAHAKLGGVPTPAEQAAIYEIMGGSPEEEPPIPEDVHKRAAALAQALFEVDE